MVFLLQLFGALQASQPMSRARSFGVGCVAPAGGILQA
jgi:hypothetical protein